MSETKQPTKHAQQITALRAKLAERQKSETGGLLFSLAARAHKLNKLKQRAEAAEAALTAARNALEHIPVQYKGRSSFDYNERLCVFEVSANGYVITSAEDSEVARAICELFNLLADGKETA